MGGFRVTQNLFIDRTLRDLNLQFRRVARFQEQITTGYRVNRPSDDPIAARRAINIRFEIAQFEQFLSNLSDSRPYLSETGTTIMNGVDILQRVRELTIQGANETNSQPQLDSIAAEVDQLLEEFLVVGNMETNGRFLFSGTRTLTTPFVETRVAGTITAVTYQGNTGEIKVAVANGSLLAINVDGIKAFQTSIDTFQALLDVRDNLLTGNQAALSAVSLGELDLALGQLLLSGAEVGAAENRVDRLTMTLEQAVVTQRILLSEKIDTDFAEASFSFNNAMTTLEAALQASARVLQPTLLNFLR